MYSGNVPEILAIILLHLSNTAVTFPIADFILMLIISTICSFSHSLNMRLKANSDRYAEMYSVDINNVFSLLNRFKLVLNVT